MRIGQGFDIHALVYDRPLIIGGVTIPFEKGLAGHSDADVLIHAICDALLGAAGLGDIGRHFPDTDPKYKNINSQLLLLEVVKLLKSHNWIVNNVDITIILEKPKLSIYKEQIVENLATILEIPIQSISVKAKTNEGQDAVGRGEAVIAQVIVSIISKQ